MCIMTLKSRRLINQNLNLRAGELEMRRKRVKRAQNTTMKAVKDLKQREAVECSISGRL